jgi:hypothetical protein
LPWMFAFHFEALAGRGRARSGELQTIRRRHRFAFMNQ